MNERETATEESVRKSLEPELSLIHEKAFREKAVKAWTMACRIGGYARLEQRGEVKRMRALTDPCFLSVLCLAGLWR